MSHFKNFIQDFPERCASILDEYYEPELKKKQGFEVTLMLAIASTGLIVPFERLRKPDAKSRPHPTKDRANYTEAAYKLDALIQEQFWSSTLWPEKTGSWTRGKVALETLEKYPSDPMGWDELDGATKIADDIKVDEVAFCDPCPSVATAFADLQVPLGLPKARLISDGARRGIQTLERIDVLPEGQSGRRRKWCSGFGKAIPADCIEQNAVRRRVIITDGSNHGYHYYRKVFRPQGVKNFGYHLCALPEGEQPFLEHGLNIVKVKRL